MLLLIQGQVDVVFHSLIVNLVAISVVVVGLGVDCWLPRWHALLWLRRGWSLVFCHFLHVVAVILFFDHISVAGQLDNTHSASFMDRVSSLHCYICFNSRMQVEYLHYTGTASFKFTFCLLLNRFLLELFLWICRGNFWLGWLDHWPHYLVVFLLRRWA